MAHTYSHLYQIPATGLRFFTVYGPWGRPDMSPILFTKAILANEPIQVFNHGDMMRDFTYIDDIIVSVKETLFKSATPSTILIRKILIQLQVMHLIVFLISAIVSPCP